MGGAGVFDPASAWGRGMGRGGGPADWWALGGVGGAGGPFGVPPSGAVQLSGPCFGLSSQVFAGSSVGREAAATSFQEQVQRSGGVQTEEPGRRGLGRVVAADGAAGGGISAMSGQRGPYMVAAADGAAGGSSGPIIAGGAQDMDAVWRQRTVWIVGHSFVHWAGERAAIRPGGQHLGLQHLGIRVSWWGQRGMRWHQLLPLLADFRRRPRRPDILLLHLGGNDVDSQTGKHLIDTILGDLRMILEWFPGTTLLWSDIIPRPRRLESRRWTRGLCKVNRQVGRWVESRGGVQLRHDWVDVSCLGLFARDRVHLSDVGWDLLLDDFSSGCERWALS
nr:uncharacterized protein LOC117368118 isoform X2 [Geotrypetes seraphini]